MDDGQIQLALHCTQLVEDKLFMLRMKGFHPHSIIGGGFVMALLHGKEFASNAEVVEALGVAYQTIPDVVGNIRSDAPGSTGHDFCPLPPEKFDSMVLQTLDLIRALKFVPATSCFLIFEDFYRSY